MHKRRKRLTGRPDGTAGKELAPEDPSTGVVLSLEDFDMFLCGDAPLCLAALDAN